MHPLFAAIVVFASVLAIAGALTLAASVGTRLQRRELPAWLDLDGSARRATQRSTRRAQHV